MPPRAARGGKRKSKGRARYNKPRARRTALTVRSLQPVPPKYVCKMKYSDTVYTDSDGQYIFNLNSVYDPDRTGIGHQPYGFDNLALLYNRYRVISCGWRIAVAQSASEAALPRMFACIPSNDQSIVWDMNELRENPRTRYAIQAPGAPTTYISGKQYIPSLMGQTAAQYMANENCAAIVNTNPSELALLYIKVTNQLAEAATGNNVQVLLEYTVEFFDPKRVVQS